MCNSVTTALNGISHNYFHGYYATVIEFTLAITLLKSLKN